MGGFDPMSTIELAQLTDLCRRWVEVHPDDVEALDLMERARRTLDEALRPWRAAIEAARDRMAARMQVPPEVMPGEHLVEGGAPLFVIHANGGVHYWRGEPVELIGPQTAVPVEEWETGGEGVVDVLRPVVGRWPGLLNPFQGGWADGPAERAQTKADEERGDDA